MHRVGVIIEEAARRTQPRGLGQDEASSKVPGDTEEAPGGTQEGPKKHQQAQRRQPGGTKIYICVCLYLNQFCYFY